MSSVEKALKALRNYPRLSIYNIKDLPYNKPPVSKISAHLHIHLSISTVCITSLSLIDDLSFMLEKLF